MSYPYSGAIAGNPLGVDRELLRAGESLAWEIPQGLVERPGVWVKRFITSGH